MKRHADISYLEGAKPLVIESVAQLREKLQSLNARHSTEPIIVRLCFDDGAELYVGVGLPDSVVSVHEPIPDSDWTLEWISVGDDSRDGELEFFLLGHHTPQPARNAIPVQTAILTAEHYYESGMRATSVTWEENRF